MMDDNTIIRLAHKAAQDELSIAVFTVNELRRFADLSFEEQTKTPKTQRNVMEFAYEINGVELICHLVCDDDVAPNQPVEYVTLEQAYHLGQNIGHLLSDEIVSEIENAALAEIKENFDDY